MSRRKAGLFGGMATKVVCIQATSSGSTAGIPFHTSFRFSPFFSFSAEDLFGLLPCPLDPVFTFAL
jgi:hypothetical protein